MQCGFVCVIYRYYSVMGLYTGGLIFGGAYIRNGVNVSNLMGYFFWLMDYLLMSLRMSNDNGLNA